MTEIARAHKHMNRRADPFGGVSGKAIPWELAWEFGWSNEAPLEHDLRATTAEKTYSSQLSALDMVLALAG